ncbi:hypothetical protein [Mycolicibacterium vinylchloridicum]|uniref:hypothetical protein n=1 Tax=Mycolicibacterium vinylchloridicum TaxID=2736928 RepID=UPI0015C89C5A|nr:hypothetical protein [Mycolicibacterium vinylchloridicum]
MARTRRGGGRHAVRRFARRGAARTFGGFTRCGEPRLGAAAVQAAPLGEQVAQS